MSVLSLFQNQYYDHFGLALFFLSTVWMSSSKSLPMRIKSPVASAVKRKRSLSEEKDYTELLAKLFAPMKNPSRHSTKALSTDEIFQLRKTFFQKLYSDVKLNSCQVIHIAGTKGKGSNAEYISSALIASGYKVGVFTSPHIHTARERIKLNRELISMSEMLEYGYQAIDLLEQVQGGGAGGAGAAWPLVFFDYLYTIALLYFGSKQPDYLILECGIGGRYDSTNMLQAAVGSGQGSGQDNGLGGVAATVITSISLDHQAILGDSIPEIAWQKAGIMKANTPCFTLANQPVEALTVFRQESELIGCPLIIVPVVNEQGEGEVLSQTGLLYQHTTQVQNVCLSYAVLQHLASRDSCSKARRKISFVGMSAFYWPCRMEKFKYPPSHSSTIAATGQQPVTIILDGCHNAASLNLFLASLSALYPAQQQIILFGAGQEKNIDAMLTELFQPVVGNRQIMMVQSKHFKSYSEQQLLQKIIANGCNQPATVTAATAAEKQPIVANAAVPSSSIPQMIYMPAMNGEKVYQHGTVAHRLLQTITSHIATASGSSGSSSSSRPPSPLTMASSNSSSSSSNLRRKSVPISAGLLATSSDEEDGGDSRKRAGGAASPTSSSQQQPHQPQSSSPVVSQGGVVIAVCGSLFVAADAREALFRLAPELFSEQDWVRFADPSI